MAGQIEGICVWRSAWNTSSSTKYYYIGRTHPTDNIAIISIGSGASNSSMFSVLQIQCAQSKVNICKNALGDSIPFAVYAKNRYGDEYDIVVCVSGWHKINVIGSFITNIITDVTNDISSYIKIN